MKLNLNMSVEIESKEDLIDIAGVLGTALLAKMPVNFEVKDQNKSEEPKAETKPAAEKVKKNKAEDKPKVEDKKDETPKVEAEITGVDETPIDQVKDAEINEENSDDEVTITKEMVREKFNAVVKSGKQKEAKQLIENLGVKKLSDVKPEDYATLIKEAEALL